MRKSSYRAYKPEPNVSSTGGRRTTETSGQSKTDSRGGASGQQRTQIAGEASTSTDGTRADNDTDRSGEVECCPECEDTHIFRVSGSHVGGPAEHDNAYRCKECSATFDEPAVRPHGDRGGNISHGLAAQLDEMDADDVGRPVTDGGPGAGPNGEDFNTTQAVFRALEELGGEREEAPVGNVINRVVVNHERPLADVLDEVSRLITHGEIYAPSAATIRRTDAPVATDGSGAIDTSFAEAVQEQLYIGDHVEDKDDDSTMVVVGLPGTTADKHIVSSEGIEPAKTVADYNEDYSEADEVIEVAYPQRTDNHLDVEDKYAFPRSRLERVASTHDLDDEGGEDDA